MYNLEPRKGFEIPTGTPALVGPTTYTTVDTTYVRKNVAPFLSTAPRSTKLKTNVDVFYDPPTIRSKIKYGNSLQFTAIRETIELGEIFEGNDDDIIPKLPRVKKSKWKKNTGKLYQCRMPFSHGPSAPSIPSHKDANGYDISERNDLIKMAPDDHDHTLGPAYYEVPTSEVNFNTKRYSGCVWSKMKEKRLKSDMIEGPGPGYYDINYNFCGHRHEDENYRAYMRKCCAVPRYTCELMCRAKKENMPGPGTYGVVDLNTLGEVKNLSANPRPFIDSTERFTYKATIGPGPQRYSMCDCINLKRSFTVKNVPFLYNSERLKASKAAASPGPGWYATPDGMSDKILAKRFGAASVPFGSTETRKWTFQDAVLDTPASVDYDVNEPRCSPGECPRETSVFRSRVCRFKWKKTDDQPDPATYNVNEAQNYVKNKKSYSKRRRAFDAMQQKFLHTYDFADVISNADNPGVGDYQIGGTMLLDKAMHFSNFPRFKMQGMRKSPGPGHYTLHPVYGESMHRTKTTHNVRLMKEVKRNHSDARLPKPTVKAPQPTGKKLLRWFVRPPE